MKAGDVLKFVCDKLELESLPDGGFEEGSPDNEVRGILTTWMATPEALSYAADSGLNLVVCHEPLYWHENEDPPLYRCPGPYNKPLDWEKHPNNVIKKIVKDAELTVLRIHFGIDRLYIYDAFAEAMELGKVIAGEVYEKVYELPRKMKLYELVEHIQNKTGLSSVRYVGDKMKTIEKVGNCWGGVGLSVNQYYARRTIQNGAQAIICGEMDEFAMFFAKQCGAALIETSHAVSENFGIKFFSDKLASEFSPVPVEFHEVKLPYRVYSK
jgi:putative NIF3 family GTP cyclohydrolase 1 type 2